MSVQTEADDNLVEAINHLKSSRDIFAKLAIDEYTGDYGVDTLKQFRATFNALAQESDKW